MAFQYVIVKNSGRGRGYLPTIMPEASIVVEILQGVQTIGEISSIYGIHPNMLARWKREALDGLPKVFERSSKQIKQEQERQQEIDELYKQIGILTTQNEWLKKKGGL